MAAGRGRQGRGQERSKARSRALGSARASTAAWRLARMEAKKKRVCLRWRVTAMYHCTSVLQHSPSDAT